MVIRPERNEIVVRTKATHGDRGFSGTVVSMGRDVAGIVLGTDVFGVASHGLEHGLVVCHPTFVVQKSVKLSDQEAAVLASDGPLALHAIRQSIVTSDARVLIADASVGLGPLAVQIAKSTGSHVTAMCPDRSVPLIWDLGADVVFAAERGRPATKVFDAIILANDMIPLDCAQEQLAPNGRIVSLLGNQLRVESMGEVFTVSLPLALRDTDLVELAGLVEMDGLFPLAL